MKRFGMVLFLMLALVGVGWGQDMTTPAQVTPQASVQMQSGIEGKVSVHNHYRVECTRDGKVLWVEEIDNLVPTAGLNYLLTSGFKSAGSTTWYVGLVGTTSTGFVAGDTANSHGSWVEIVGYTNTVRPTLTLGTASSGSVDNSASTAQFTMTGTTVVYGAAIFDQNTKGSASAGTNLYGEGAFTTSRSVVANDVLNVTITLTLTASDARDVLFEFLDQVAVLWEPVEEFRM